MPPDLQSDCKSDQPQAQLHRPNTFLIGAPKCGTSAMSTYLATHPNVFVCNPKEPQFWAEEFDQSKYLELASLSQYENLFRRARPGQRCIVDASTGYVWSACAVKRILEYSPDAKILVMFRNPTEVVQALHMEMCSNLREDVTDFEASWRLQESRSRGENIPANCACAAQYQYRQVAAFGRQLQRLQQLVPSDRLKVILFDDFKAHTRQAYLDVLSFLDLPDDGRTSFPAVNAARHTRFKAVKRFFKHPPPVLRPLERALRSAAWSMGMVGLRDRFFRTFFDKAQKRRPLSPELAREISAAFADEVELLGTLLQRDLSHWTASTASR